MAKELTTGLIMAADSLSWSTIQSTKGRIQQMDQGDFPLPVEVEGEEDLGEIVADVLKEHRNRFVGRLVLAIPTDQVLLKVLEIPGATDEDLPGIVEIQADKLSPFPIDNMVVSYEVLQRTEDSARVLVAAVQTDQVQAVGVQLKDLGLKIRRVDVEALGWWSVLQEAGEVETDGNQIFILLSGAVPTVLLVCDGVPQVIRSLKSCAGLSGDDLTDALGQEINLTLMSRELTGESQVLPAITVYKDETAESISVASLAKSSGAEVRVKALESLPPCAQGIAQRASQQRAGSTVTPGSLDLTPSSWSNEQQSALFKRKMIQTAAVIVGVWLLTVGSLMGLLYYEQQRLDQLKVDAETVGEPARQVRLLRRRAKMIESYVDHSHSALECLLEVARLQPAGIDLTSFSYRKDDEVKVTGISKAVAMVYDFKNRLDGAAFFPAVVLNGPRTVKAGELFDLTFKFEGDDS